MTANSENTVSLEEVLQQLQTGSSMPAELLEIFAEEADEHLRIIYDGLNRLKKDHGDADALAEVRRSSHTLKGAAGAVNLQAATRLAHRMEDLLDRLAERNETVSEKQLKLILATADQLQDLTTGDFEADAVAQQIVDLYQGYTDEMGGTGQPSSETSTTTARKNAKTKKSVSKKKTPSVPATAKKEFNTQKPTANSGAANTQYLRVPLNRLDEMVALLGEMIVNRSEFQQRLEDFEARIEDMHNALERLRNVAHYVEKHQSDQIAQRGQASHPSQRRFGSAANGDSQRSRHDDFDPLEFEQYTEFYLLSQTLSEADNDAEIMSGEFRNVKTAFDSLLRRQQQLNRDAQKSLMRIRMVPFSGIVSRLERTVRTVANKLGRNVELEVIGERIELDKTVMDEITDPLFHLIRNGIDHGVEDPEIRAFAGKPETARLTIKAINQGTQITLKISDDGAGIDLDKVREKAIQQELIKPDQNLSNEEMHALIFRPGFSTAAQLTDVSGRGVGMDVVADAIRRLKGTIRVDSEEGVGTTFTIKLPTTLGVSRAVLVESTGKKFAIPLQSIQQILRLDPLAVTRGGEDPKICVGSTAARLVDLSAHLNLLPEEKYSKFENAAPMLLLGNGDEEVAVTVDKILGSRDIVIKSLGKHLKKIRGIVGATIDGDGSVIPILDTTDLIDQDSIDVLSVSGCQDYASNLVRRDLAMVVDDSISVRRVSENLLQASGWDVVTAKDGVDALEKLAQLDKTPDVFLCDMEMPRMDGIELIRQIREQSEFELTPIVMVTSRASEKHRHKAFEAGATDYVVKPFNGEQLLEMISGLVQSARETVTV